MKTYLTPPISINKRRGTVNILLNEGGLFLKVHIRAI